MSHFAGWFWSFHWIITGYFIVDTWHHLKKKQLRKVSQRQTVSVWRETKWTNYIQLMFGGCDTCITHTKHQLDTWHFALLQRDFRQRHILARSDHVCLLKFICWFWLCWEPRLSAFIPTGFSLHYTHTSNVWNCWAAVSIVFLTVIDSKRWWAYQ